MLPKGSLDYAGDDTEFKKERASLSLEQYRKTKSRTSREVLRRQDREGRGPGCRGGAEGPCRPRARAPAFTSRANSRE